MKHYGLIVLIVVLAGSLIFGDAEGSPTQTVIKLSLASISAPAHATTPVFQSWAKELEEATQGKISVTFYLGQSLLKGPDMYKGVVAGTAEIGYALPAFTPGRFPLISVMDLPFLFPDAKTGTRTVWHLYEKFPEVQAEWRETKVLALWTLPTAKILTKKKIRTIDDLKGLKIAATGTVSVKTMELLGPVPINMPAQDQYLALTQGVIVGSLMPLEAAETNKFYEALSYFALPGTNSGTMFLVMNRNVWESLPADVKKTVEKHIGEKLARRMGEALDARDIVAKQSLEKNGMVSYEFSAPEIEKIRHRVKAIWDEWTANMQTKGLPGKAVLDEAVRFIEQQK